jgi:hypothetical protein
MTFPYTKRENIERACAFLAASQAPQLAAFRASADGRVDLVWVGDRGVPWPGGTVKRLKRPVLAIVGADMDDGRDDPGPAGWLCSRRLRDWCSVVIVHGSGGEAAHYREAVRAAELTGRCALIETTSARARDWATYFQPKRCLVILPRGGVHPIPSDRRTAH